MQKSSCIIPHETVACVPRHTIRMRDKVRPDKLREAVEQALLRFPHMMLTAEPTETAFRYRRNVQPAVVLPFDGVSTRYTIGSKDTNGYLFLVGYHDKTIYMEYQHSISDGRGFEEFIRCVLFQYLKNCGFPVENDGSVRGMDTRWSPEESANGYEQLADREFSPDGIWKKPEAVHAPEVQWGADGCRGRHRGDVSVFAAARLRKVHRRQSAVCTGSADDESV